MPSQAILKLDDDQNGGLVPSKPLYSGDVACAHRLKFSIDQNLTGSLSLPARTSLVFSAQGTSVILDGNVTVCPPGNVTLILGFSQVRILLTAGRHVLDVLQWHPQAAPPCAAFLDASVQSHSVTSVPVDTVDSSVLERLGQAVQLSVPLGDFQLLSIAIELATRLVTLPSSIQIAPVLHDISENLSDLLAHVREDPSRAWSLTEASELAGYSSFHFSRMFKQSVGCGFHEYVDRLRTQAAVAFMTGERATLAAAAERAGFSSARSLRESIRDYLGVAPSDLVGSRN